MIKTSPFDWAQKELEELKSKNLYRKFRVLEELKGTKAKIAGKEATLFCGNDYLGLSQHPKLIKTFRKVADEWGIGTGSARLISGTSKWHEALEKRIAGFLGKEKALIFSSGYLANLGALSALTNEKDLIILDKLCHASLIDAAKLSDAKIRIFPHKNLNYLEKILQNSNAKRNWIVTDSIFSMDGDLAPLEELVRLKKRYGAYLVIDEAHGTGVFGKTGKGVGEELGVSDEIDVHIGTLSKAVGTIGGFVAGPEELIHYLINHARTFLFDTSLPAPICAAAAEAFDLIEEEKTLKTKLWGHIERIREGLSEMKAPILEGSSPIIPVVFGDEKKTLDAAEALWNQGFLIPAIRYPTVAKGRSRLRITVSSTHTENDIERLLFRFKRLLA